MTLAEPAAESPAAPRRTRWGRGLLIALLLLLCIGLIRFGYPAWRQRALVNALRAQGFRIETQPVFLINNPEWLKELSRSIVWHQVSVAAEQPDLGTDEQMQSIGELFALTYPGFDGPPDCSLSMGHSMITDEGLGRLRGISHLSRVDLNSLHITDSGLANLGDISRCNIHIEGAQLTPNVLLYLQGLEHLHHISLIAVPNQFAHDCTIEVSSGQLTITTQDALDESLALIKDLPRLKSLLIRSQPVTDHGINHLRNLPAVEIVLLTGTHVTSACLQPLSRLPALRDLNLNRTRITDEGFSRLLEFPSLQSLSLNDTAISDASLPALSKLVKHCHLSLHRTQISEEGLKQLEADVVQYGGKFLIQK